MFNQAFPSIDLHGMDREIACISVHDFLVDAVKLKYEKVIIIHGIGKGILRQSIHDYLKKEKLVLEYKLDFMNPGCTLVTLQKR